MLRKLLEKLSRGIAFKKKLTAEFERRTIFVSPEGGGLRYWKPSLASIDPMLLNVVRNYVKPRATVWDVGGNLGFFALTAAIKSKGNIVVFEPDLSLAHLLRKTADANPDLDISIIPLAVSNSDGIALFNIAERARSTNFLTEAKGSTQTGGVRQTVQVPTIRLDTALSWFNSSPQLIKIDVEGAEHLVLEGMRHILSTVRPIVVCEVTNDNYGYVKDVLSSHNYRLLDANRLPTEVEFKLPADNVLALPL